MPGRGQIVIVAIGLAAAGTMAAQPGSVGVRAGDAITFAEKAEPKTLNLVIAVDSVSRDVLQRRRGIPIADGRPFEAEDVLFTFRRLLDRATGSPQRDLLMVHGKPVQVRKQDTDTVVFKSAEPYAPGERRFDGIAILPRPILEAVYREHRVGETWGVGSAPGQIVGLGPFRLREYVPGQRLLLEKNPYYWRLDLAGRKLDALAGWQPGISHSYALANLDPVFWSGR
jgi:hypothetical protein